MRGIRPAKHIIVVPQAVGCEQRDVRSIAHRVARIAENRLPRRLGPSLAGSTHNPADSWRSSRAATGATSARRRALKVSAKKTAAKAKIGRASCRERMKI